MARLWQIVLLVSTLLLSWLMMQVVHELGHIGAALATGGHIVHVELCPWSISRTDVNPNPHPLIVVWGGPLLGALLPLLVWVVMSALRLPSGFLRFFAGFCLIANGAYIGFGSFQGIGDCGQMLRDGSPIWILWLFGIVTIPVGLFFWNGMGSYFDIGNAVDKTAFPKTIATTTALIVLSVIELLLNH